MRRTLLALLLACPLFACTDESTMVAPRPQMDHHDDGITTLGVTVVGPDGNSVCESLPEGSEVSLNLYIAGDLGSSGRSFTCPSAFVEMVVDSGVPIALLVEATDDDVPGWPYSELNAYPDAITPLGDTSVILQIPAGRQLGGRAYLDGMPVQGAYLIQPYFETPLGHLLPMSSAWTDADGHWIEEDGESFLLAPGAGYRAECQPGTGMRRGSGPTPDDATQVFREDFDRLICRFRTSRRTRFTHSATNLQLTAEPGQLDPEEGDSEDGFGFPFTYPTGAQLSRGPNMGSAVFVVADDDGHIYAPRQEESVYGCFTEDIAICSELVLDGSGHSDPDGAGRRVRWEMYDSAGVLARRFSLMQTSWDGALGDYVLYRFRIRNEGAQPLTLYPAWHVDWHIGGNFGDEGIAGTTMNGRLVYARMGGVFLGTYIVPTTPLGAVRVAECCNIAESPTESIEVLQGLHNQFGPLGPAMVGSTHGVVMTIPAGSARSFWMAFVAGSTLSELRMNALAARDDARNRM